MNMRASKKGLSPLLAIIIGLVVTIVAGILLAQLYFSYAATLSSRPAANVEYVDLVVPTGGTSGTLVISIKNTGNIYIQSGNVKKDSTTLDCTIPKIYPGGVNSTVCSVSSVTPGMSYTFIVSLAFADKSNQTLAVVARARTA
jgi:hypothetical protein